jgi:hypothetical protein
MAHSDAGVKNTRRRACAQKSCHNCTALTSACLLSLKGSVASFWLCADDFRSSPAKNSLKEEARQPQSAKRPRAFAESAGAALAEGQGWNLTLPRHRLRRRPAAFVPTPKCDTVSYFSASAIAPTRTWPARPGHFRELRAFDLSVFSRAAGVFEVTTGGPSRRRYRPSRRTASQRGSTAATFRRNHFPHAMKPAGNEDLARYTRSNNGVRSCWPPSSMRYIAKSFGPLFPVRGSSAPDLGKPGT